jgi:hypothetical protein
MERKNMSHPLLKALISEMVGDYLNESYEDDLVESIFEEVSDETWEAIEEAILNELSPKTLASYVKKASQSAARNAETSGKHWEKSTNASDIDAADRYFVSSVAKGAKSNKRLKGISRATDRLVK